MFQPPLNPLNYLSPTHGCNPTTLSPSLHILLSFYLSFTGPMVVGGSSHLQISGVADGYVPATWAGELPYNRRRRIANVSPISLCNESFSLCHTFGFGGDGDLLLLEKNKGRL